ncbi:MAG: DUF58 domain-containing protein [Turicibacter sp.]|nr:DUF58 domain-containing protein [Turicibacter sp.]
MNISVSRRFVTFALVGIAVLFVVGLLGIPTLTNATFWGYNIILFAALAIDFFISPPTFSLKVKRIDADTKLSHNAVNKITFLIYNSSHSPLAVEATDTIASRHFEVLETDLSHIIPPGEEKSFSYSVIPSKRGAFTFTHIHLRVVGILGLAMKFHSLKYPAEFKVYPNLQDLQRYRIMAQNNRLLATGDKTLPQFGQGTEFESLRAYIEGDDYRKINWSVTARERRLIVNDYQVEKNQPVFMLIDSGRPMSYSVGGYKKLDYAINTALVLSDIVNQKGDMSGLLVFDTKIQNVIMPNKGSVHRNTLMESLYHIEESRNTSNYAEAFRTIRKRQKRRSLVFVFTDFETLEEGLELTREITLLKRWHFPIIITIKNERLTALTLDEDSHVAEVANSFLDERVQLFRALNSMKIPVVEMPADKITVSAINQYLTMRKANYFF